MCYFLNKFVDLLNTTTVVELHLMIWIKVQINDFQNFKVFVSMLSSEVKKKNILGIYLALVVYPSILSGV